MEEQVKKKSNGVVIILLIIFAMCMGVGGFFLGKSFNKEEVKPNENGKEKEKCEVTIPKSEYSHSYPEYVDSKGNLYTYYLGNNRTVDDIKKEFDITLNVSEDKKTVDMIFGKKMYEQYALNIGEDYSTTLKFEKEIKQIVVGGFGQAVGDERIVFLLVDGTLKYLDPYMIITNQDNKELAIPKIVENVDHVVALNLLEVDTMFSYYSIGAIRSDGTIYDLSELLKRAN